jgi:uncharacterized phage protein (TIGR01671 family)
MSRTIKFRAWNPVDMEMLSDPNVYDAVGINDNFENFESDGYSMMQYTGLNDKNGVEIYEGDILQPSAYIKSSFNLSEIVFKDGIFRLSGKGKHQTLIGSLRASRTAGNDYIVIGNIYENPELLEKEK